MTKNEQTTTGVNWRAN